MSNFGTKWLKAFIPAALVLMTGIGGIGTLVSGAISVASGSPIKSVVKDVAVDTAKEKAINTIYGSSDDNNGSILDLFKKQKYKAVSDKKSGPWGYIAPGWYIECYRINNSAYMGNRKYNKARGTNIRWDMTNATDFEIANFKKNVPYSDSYIAYDSNSFTFVIGELKKAQLNGYTLVYDEYYDKYKLINYKKGKEKKSIELNELESQNIKGIQVNKTDDSTYEINIPKENRTYIINTEDNTVKYESDHCLFEGSAFQFSCKYNYNVKKEEWVKYDYTVMQNIKVNCSDGTVGEIKMLDDKDESKEAVTAKTLSIALIKLGVHTTVDIIVSDSIGALDTAVEVATGQSISDMINVQVDKIIDGAVDNIEKSNNNTEDNSKNYTIERTDEGFVVKEEGTDTNEGNENEEDDSMFSDENKNEDGSYTLPSGVKISFD